MRNIRRPIRRKAMLSKKLIENIEYILEHADGARIMKHEGVYKTYLCMRRRNKENDFDCDEYFDECITVEE
jgi:hypothetical protein